MKYTIISILILGVLIFLVACKAKKAIAPVEVGEPVMTLSKSSCFGKCKVYNANFYEDKSVTYEGLDNVDNIGTFKAKISESEYLSLVALFEAANFSNLENEYLSGVRDKQKTTLSFSQKTVVYQKRAASDELKAITNGIDAVLEKIEWVKD